MDLDPGTVVANRYRISRQLGRGGMGEVFAAENIRTGRPVAVKLLRSDSKTKSSAVARFRREARAAGSINSDHVTQVLDVEEDTEHGIVLVFELLEGESLIDRLKRTGPIPFDELYPIIEQVWIGLADAHKAGIIHRDLKPSNVFLERRPDGQTRVKILDFGISKLPKEMGGETLTEMGQSLGTFSFMPPEQIGKAKTVDHRADIYACGTLIYQAMSGQLPYVARNILVMVEMKSKSDARTLAEAMGGPVDARLEAFLARTLAREPSARFQSANEALASWKELRPNPGGGRLGRDEMPSNVGAAALGRGSADSLPSSFLDAPPMDSTEDTAATIAMPIAQFREDPVAGDAEPPGPEPEAAPPEAGHEVHVGRMNLGGTIALPAPTGPGQTRIMESRPPHMGPEPQAGAPLAPAYARPISSPPPAGPLPSAHPSSQPPASGSQAPTTVYTKAGLLDAAAQAGALPMARRQRSAVPFVVGAVAFALVGFGIVAFLLQYLKVVR